MNTFQLPERSGAYRWYYVDVSAGDFTAVFIFMVGSIFSARYSAALRKGGLPREHAAVNFALYERGVRRRWVLTEYAQPVVSLDGRRLDIGRSWIEYGPQGLTAEIHDRTTPFMMTEWGVPTEVRLELTALGPTGHEVQLVPGLSHCWRPIAAHSRARVTLANEPLSFEGRAYHDGNHGEVPLGSDLRGWDWVRTLTPNHTEITYRPWADAEAHRLLITKDSIEHGFTRETVPTRYSSWGLKVPRSLGVDSEVVLVESSPFYARAESIAGGSHAMAEVADFRRFHSPTVRWMSDFKTRYGKAS